MALAFGAVACSDDDNPVRGTQLVDIVTATDTECPTGGVRVRVAFDDNVDGAIQEAEVTASELVCNGATGADGEPGEPGADGNDGNEGTPGIDGTNALVRTSEEPAGANCANGGLRVDVGLDDDANGTLDPAEIDQTSYVCNGADGADGLSSLVVTSTNTQGACAGTGVQFEVGIDSNGNGTLDPAEVDDTRVVCDGVDGDISLVETSSEAAGANCVAGGIRVVSGVDGDGNGSLTGTEIADVSFICDPVRSLVAVSSEVAGSSTQCPNGGTRIDSGFDTNANGQLDPAEITQTSFSCNGDNGAASLVSVTPVAAGADCANGGSRVDTGPDTNGNGQLDAGEVVATNFVCNGADGQDGQNGANGSLTRVSAEPAGANCLNGGSRIETGPDANFNGVLDATEINSTSFVCNGAARESLVTSTPIGPGADCATGGFRIDSGLDANGNGVLDAAEINSTSFACNGANGALTSVTPEPPGANCLNGGSRVDTGPDVNFNGVLDAAEINSTSFVCNGAARESLVTSTPIPSGPECANGGFRVDAGLDLNGNATLDAAEITTTSFVCNGLASVPFALQTASLPDGQANQPYAATIIAAGGTGGNYTWSVSGGTLPAGLTLDATGTPGTNLTGAPTVSGSFTFTVQAVDFFGQAASRSYTIDIAPPALEITTFTVPAVDTSTTYSFNLGAIGGSPPYTWTVSQGALPTGLSLSAAGVISGTPTLNQVVDTQVRVTDNAGATRDARLTFMNQRRWVGFVGDATLNSAGEAYVADISGAAPGTALSITPAVSTTQNLGQTSAPSYFDLRLSRSGDKAVFIGDFDVGGAEEIFFVDLEGASPSSPVKLNAPFTSSNFDVDTDDIFFSPDGRWVAYIADDTTNSEFNLFVVDTTASPLTSVQVNGTLPTSSDVDTSDGFQFSPDSTKLAYISDENTAAVETLFVVDLTASPLTPQQVSSGAATSDVFSFTWSPDSTRLLFVADETTADLNELYISDVSGTTPTPPVRVNAPITNSSGDVNTSVSFDRPADFGFSPDGTKIFYIADARTESVDELYVVDVDSPGVARLVSQDGRTNTGDDVDRAFFTPDSQNIVFVSDTQTTGVLEVFLADATGTRLTGPVALNAPFVTNGDVSQGSANFSSDEVVVDPNNRGVFFMADGLLDGEEELFFSAFSNPGAMTNIAPDIGSGEDINSFLVSPDGTLLIFNGDVTGSSVDELFAVDISGATFSTPSRVNGPLVSGGDVDTSVSSTARDYDIVGNGVGVVYIADETTDIVDQPYYVPLTGATPGTSTSLITPVTSGDVFNVHTRDR